MGCRRWRATSWMWSISSVAAKSKRRLQTHRSAKSRSRVLVLAALHGGDDLLRQVEGQRIGPQGHRRSVDDRREVDRRRPPRVAEGDVQRERDLRPSQSRDELAADALVLGVFAHDFGPDARRIDLDPVLRVRNQSAYLCDYLLHAVGVVADAVGREIGVVGHPSHACRGHQHPALEHHPLGVIRRGQSPQEGLDRVDDQQRLRVASMLGPGSGLQGTERLGGTLAQLSNASSADAICAAPPISRAISVRRAGCASRRSTYRRTACSATSRPTQRDMRIASTTDRSAE